MDRFTAELQRTRSVISEHMEAIRRVFVTQGMSTLSLRPFGEVGQWIDEQLPGLRRRNQMVRAMSRLPAWSPGTLTGLVSYKEDKILPPAEAQQQGRDLGARYKDIDPDPFLGFDPGLDEKYQKIVDALAAHADDPDFTAAFFTALGLNRTLALPGRLDRGLQKGQAKATEVVSRAFGTAVTSGGKVAGFAAIAESVKHTPAVGPLLGSGRFPIEWLAEVAVGQVFTPGNKVSGAALTPYLDALAKDPAAARLAISLATRDSPLPRDTLRALFPFANSSGQDRRLELTAFLKDLNTRAATDASSANAFGQLLASASGASNERDGKHSDAAARFAFTVMTTADDMKLAEQTKIHLAQIAGAYATEMTEGANLGDANQLLPSAFGTVASQIPGLTSAFRLTPKDTYRFISTFSDRPANRTPFETGMGDLARRLIDQGVPAMLKDKDATRLDNVFAALGNVHGLELAAQEKYAKPADDIADANSKAVSFGIGTILGAAGFLVPEAGQLLWAALSADWSLLDTYKDDGPSQVEKLQSTDNLETLGRQHTIAQSLLDAGFTPKISPQDYQATCPPGVAITDGNGKLRPFKDIVKSGEPGLQALDQWFIENGMGSEDELSLGKLSNKESDMFDGRKNHSQVRAHSYEEVLMKLGTPSDR